MSKKIWLLKSNTSDYENLDFEVRRTTDIDLNILNKKDLNILTNQQKNSNTVLIVEFSNDLNEHDETISKIKKINKSTKIICISRSETRELLLKLIRLNITDYVESHLSAKNLEDLYRKYSFERRSDSNRAMDPHFSKSARVNKLLKTIDQISDRPINVLLTGESGSGKEFFSNYLVKNSSRANKPFIAVNCPAIPENLFESELFGHEKGSFTGAEEQKIGKIEMANGGILFLDEIGDLPVNAQTKLLRVIQEKEIERVGGTEKVPVDFTLISATSKNIKHEIQCDKFRADLYYRIAEIELEIPSLKERIEDIDHLSRLFLSEFSTEMRMEPKRLNAESIRTLYHHQWPGNIRELKSVLKKLLILSKGHIIQRSDVLAQLPDLENVIVLNPNTKNAEMELKDLKIKESEKILIGKAIQESQGNLSKAAKIIGLSRSTLYRKIKKYDLKFSA